MVRIAASSAKKKSTAARPRPPRGAGAGERQLDVTEMFESCIGCKWTLHVLAQIRKGVRRSAPGLTAKVLGERLNKLQRFGIIERTSHPEIPPRVEYSLTPFGQKFVKVIDQIEALKAEIADDTD